MVKSNVIDAFSGFGQAPEAPPAAVTDASPWHHEEGFTVPIDADYGEGTIEYQKIGESMVLGTPRFRPSGRPTCSTAGKTLVKLNFQLQGRARFSDARRRSEFDVLPMTAGIMLHPAGMEKSERYDASEPQVSTIISCDPCALPADIWPDAGSLPAPLRKWLEAGRADFFYIGLPMTLDMVASLRALTTSDYSGSLRSLYAEAKALELVCQFFRRLGEPGDVSARERKRLDAARRRLDEDFVSPPCIRALAHEFGTNEARLSAGFRRVFGMTIFDYIQKLRMQHACRLLVDTDLPVTQIAYDVGYEYPGNFATAFKRHFGMSPRELRRR